MTDINQLFRQNELFSNFTQEKLNDIARFFVLVDFDPGQVVFCEGDSAQEMYIVVSGEILISRSMGAGQRELKRMFPGDVFGEMALISNSPRSASAFAKSKSCCLGINKEDFFEILDNDRDFERHITQIIIKRIKNTEENANRYILKAYDTLLFSLANLTELRDNETGSHLLRVRHYCRLLAEKLSCHPHFESDIDPLFIENIFIVSPMHDIGKVAIPDAVMLKSGKLSDAEFALMQQHSSVGAGVMKKLLDEISFPTFAMGYNITLYHHERYDGSGYPVGLKGEDIPLEARIMSLADVFDALLSKRVYKPAFSFAQVVSIFREERGKQFDPLITDVMLASIEEFREIYLEYSNPDVIDEISQ